MSSINKTPHYNLSQFGDSPDDRPSWRGDYTADMSKIDAQMFRNATDATNALSTANGIKSTADNALKLAQTNEDKVSGQASYFNALGVTSLPTAQALMSAINGKAEATALTALQGAVSGLTDTVAGKANGNDVYTKVQADTTFTKQGGYSGTAQQLNQAIQTNASDIAEAKAGIEEIKPQLTPLNDIANGLTGATKWTGAHINRNIGAFQVNMWVYYNEPSGLFAVLGEMFASSVTANTAFKAGFTQSSDTAALFPGSWRPSSDVEIPVFALTTSGSTIASASLIVNPRGTLEASVAAAAVPGSGKVSIDIRFWGQICSIGLVKTLES